VKNLLEQLRQLFIEKNNIFEIGSSISIMICSSIVSGQNTEKMNVPKGPLALVEGECFSGSLCFLSMPVGGSKGCQPDGLSCTI